MGRRPALCPNTKGWRAPWRHAWGPLSDGRSRLARRATRHAVEELQELGVIEPTPLQRRRASRLGQFLALADMIAAGIGVDPKATVRRLTALQKSSESERRALRSLVGRSPRPTLRDYLAGQAKGGGAS